MEVVEHEYEGLRLGQKLKELSNRAVAVVALLLRGHVASAGEVPKRREDVPELCLDLTVQFGKAIRLETGDVLVQGINEDRERQVTLELRGGPG
jgi:hypothetical protein